MKKLLIIPLIVIGIAAAAQTPAGYTKINARYDWLAGRFDSTFILPGYNDTPRSVRHTYFGAGQMGVDSLHDRVWFYSSGSWHLLANNSTFSSYVPTTRAINNGYGVLGGGALSADLTLRIDSATFFQQIINTLRVTTNGTSGAATWNLPARTINIPNYAVTGGTVTSVAMSGGTTGLTTAGGPITTTGTFTLAGTLVVANGGTGANTFTSNGVLYGNSTSAVQVTAAGTAGQLFVGSSGAPGWSNTVSVLTNFTAGLATNTTPTSANLYVGSGSGGVNVTTGALQYEGSTNNTARIFFNGTTDIVPGAGAVAGYFAMAATNIDEAGSGTHPLLYGIALAAPLIIPGSATVTNTATLYISDAPSATVTGENSAIWVRSGNIRMGKAGTAAGTFSQEGATSGKISFLTQAAAGTYNMNWPITAGTSGQFLTSAAGGSSPMTWTTPSVYTSNSGLTMTANNTQLGGALLNSPTISGSTSYAVSFTGSYGTGTNNGVVSIIQSGTNGNGLYVTNNGTGGNAITAAVTTDQIAISAIATNSNAVQASATSGTAFQASVTSGIGINSLSQTGYAGVFTVVPSSTNTTVPILSLVRGTTSTAANNIGVSVDFTLEADDGFGQTSNQLITKWTTAATATTASEFSITGVNAGTLSTLFKLAGTGQPTFSKLGVGTFTGTAAYNLAVTSAGAIIETAAPLTLASGRYTPSNLATSNAGSATIYEATYLRVGNSVTVSGKIAVTITNCANVGYISLSLPVASAMTDDKMLNGVANEVDYATISGIIYGDTANDGAYLVLKVQSSCTGFATAVYWYTYTYYIE